VDCDARIGRHDNIALRRVWASRLVSLQGVGMGRPSRIYIALSSV